MALACLLLLPGCFGSDSDGDSPVAPPSFVTLKGTLTPPDQIDSSLLASLVTNNDTPVRNAFKDAVVWVNGFPAASCTVDSSATGSGWPLRIYNVPQNAQRNYKIQVFAGKIVLKSNILEANRENFAINTETTAAALLAEALKKTQEQMLASYPSVVNSLKTDLLNAARKTATELGNNLVLAGTIDTAVKKYQGYVEALGDLNSDARLAYLQKENDLDGDGHVDLQIVQPPGGTRIKLLTTLATATSLFIEAANLSSYSDNAVLDDFAQSRISEGNTFDRSDKDFIVGLFLKRSALADQYVKVLVRRIDIDINGNFSGVVAEYAFISTGTTAISTGTRTLQLQNAASVEGAVAATDFLKDGVPADNNLTYISTARGIGCYSGNQMLVAVIDGQSPLENLSSAPKISTGVYFADTAAALNDLKPGRTLQIGDVFSAYFPGTRHYALFKIKQIDSFSITVDYKVNSTPDEPRF